MPSWRWARAAERPRTIEPGGVGSPLARLWRLALRLWSAPLRVGEVPAAPEDLIELDIGEQPVGADLGQLVFGRKQQLLGFEHLVIIRQPALIALKGDPDRVRIGFDGSGLLGLDLDEFLQRDQRA